MADDTEWENILLRYEDDIAILTIARERALNALNPQTIEELEEAIEEIAHNRTVRALIITGAGTKAFVAGADISAMPGMDAEEAEQFSATGSAVLCLLEELPIAVIAAVNGFALGGGCELAMACDFIYASDNAVFGQPEVDLGIIAGFGGTQRLLRRVGYGQAMELLMSGRKIKADEALRIGLVNRVVAADELMDGAIKSAKLIASKAPKAVGASKNLVQVACNSTLADGLSSETRAFGDLFQTDDAKEGIQAFIDKRKAVFKGS